jgi:hypothetical protein
LSSTGRRFLCAVAAVACVALMGTARPPRPTPTPSPSASPTPAPVNPFVLIYPFEIQGDLPPATGFQVAQIFAQQIQSQPDINVLPLPAGVVRANYLSTAVKLGADYYVSGFLTPLGDGASLVQQIVSVQTGIQVFSRTAIIQNTGDAQAQAQLARTFIIAYSGRYAASVDESDAQATPTPSADNGSSVSLGGLGSLFGLFKHGGGTSHSSFAPPAQVADANKPTRVVIVPRVSGPNVSADTLTSATQALQATLSRAYRTQGSELAIVDVAQSADRICGANRNATVAAGSLSEVHQSGFRGKTTSTFTLDVYTCFGATLFHTTQTAAGLHDAINAATAAYASAHPSNS